MVPPLNTAEPATKSIGSGGKPVAGNIEATHRRQPRCRSGHPAVIALTSLDLAEQTLIKAWPPKPGLTDITNTQVDHVDDIFDEPRSACPDAGETPALLAERADRLQQSDADAGRPRRMHGDVIAAGLERRPPDTDRRARSSVWASKIFLVCGRIALLASRAVGNGRNAMPVRHVQVWIQSAPAAIGRARTSSPSLAASDARIDSAMTKGALRRFLGHARFPEPILGLRFPA